MSPDDGDKNRNADQDTDFEEIRMIDDESPISIARPSEVLRVVGKPVPEVPSISARNNGGPVVELAVIDELNDDLSAPPTARDTTDQTASKATVSTVSQAVDSRTQKLRKDHGYRVSFERPKYGRDDSVTSTSTKCSTISSSTGSRSTTRSRQIRSQDSVESTETQIVDDKEPCISVQTLNFLLSLFWMVLHLGGAFYVAFYYTERYVVMGYLLLGAIFYLILAIGNRIRLPHLYVFAYMYTSMTLIMLSFVLISCLFMDIVLAVHGKPYDNLGVIVNTTHFWTEAGIFEGILLLVCAAMFYTLRKMFHDYSLACAKLWNNRMSKRNKP